MEEPIDGTMSMEAVMTQLVEIAAQLQAELHRNEQLEAENIRLARMETIAHAGRALRHEINNPLFVITASVESSLKRLRGLAAGGLEEAETLCVRLERVLEASERIRLTVQTFAETTRAVTKDYLPGVPMLDLNQQ